MDSLTTRSSTTYITFSECQGRMKMTRMLTKSHFSGLVERRESFYGFVANIVVQEYVVVGTLAISQICNSVIIGPFLYIRAFCGDIRLMFTEVDRLSASKKSATNRFAISREILRIGKLQCRIIEYLFRWPKAPSEYTSVTNCLSHTEFSRSIGKWSPVWFSFRCCSEHCSPRSL